MSLEDRLKAENFVWPASDSGHRDVLLTAPDGSAKAAHTTVWETWMLYLAPANLVRGAQVCPYSTPQCRKLCLYTAGRGHTPTVKAGRVRRTTLAMDRPADFLSALCAELDRLQRRAARTGKQVAVRLNGTSDVRWEQILDFTYWPGLRFYDYTKWPIGRRDVSGGYRLVQSVDERWSDVDIMSALAGGGRLSVVSRDSVDVWRGRVPEGVYVAGEDDGELPAIDGPSHMLIVLAPKGEAKSVTTGGFVR